MKQQAEKAFKEMLEISTDVDKAILFSGDEVLASNLPEALWAPMVEKAREISAVGGRRALEMGAGPLTQLVIESKGGSVFLVQEGDAEGLAILATGKRGSRIGLLFYDMRTCLRDTRDGTGRDDSAESAPEVEE